MSQDRKLSHLEARSVLTDSLKSSQQSLPTTANIAGEAVQAEGSLIWDTSSDTLYISNGTAWVPTGGSTGEFEAVLIEPANIAGLTKALRSYTQPGLENDPVLGLRYLMIGPDGATPFTPAGTYDVLEGVYIRSGRGVISADEQFNVLRRDGLASLGGDSTGLTGFGDAKVEFESNNEVILRAPTIRLVGNVVQTVNTTGVVVTNPAADVVDLDLAGIGSSIASFLLDIGAAAIPAYGAVNMIIRGGIIDAIKNGDFPTPNAGQAGVLAGAIQLISTGQTPGIVAALTQPGAAANPTLSALSLVPTIVPPVADVAEATLSFLNRGGSAAGGAVDTIVNVGANLLGL